jgi:RNA polymerase II-associated factor 1
MELEPEDSALLKDEIGPSRMPSSTAKPSVSWLRRTEYISGEYSKITGIKGTHDIKTIGTNAKVSKNTYETKEDHIQAIEESFESVKKIHAHPTKPNVTMVDTIPVLPDKYLWMNQYTLCTFDDDPTITKKGSVSSSTTEALMKPMKNPDDPEDRFVLYFIPNEILKKKHTSYVSDSDQNFDVYECAKELAMELKVEPKGQQYFFVQRKDGIYYNELNSKLILHRRRVKGKYPKETIYEKPSLLFIKPRELTSEEIEIQNEKLKDLL